MLTRIQLLQHVEFSPAFPRSENCRCYIVYSITLFRAHSSEEKVKLIQYDRMLRMVMPLFYEVPLCRQGLLIILYFKVFSQRAKKTVVCQVLWMLLLHQAVISVITEHKRDRKEATI